MENIKKHKKYFISILTILVLVMLILGVSFYSTITIIKNQSITIGTDSLKSISYNSQNILNSAETMLDMANFSISGMSKKNVTKEYMQEYIASFSDYIKKNTDNQCSGIYCYINGTFFDKNGFCDDFEEVHHRWYGEAVKADGENAFIVSDDRSTITVAKYIKDCGAIAVDIDTKNIAEFMNSFILSDSIWSISDAGGNIIICSSEEKDHQHYTAKHPDDSGMYEFTGQDQEKYTVFYQRINNSWYVNMIIKSDNLYSESYIILQRQMIFSIVFCVIIFILYTSSYLSNIKSENASEIKSKFLANISHEIRTPMNGIVGLTKIAKDNIDSPEQVLSCINKIETSTEFLQMLINDILDVSKIESGKMSIQNEPFNLENLVSGIEEFFKPYIEGKKNIRFAVNRDYEDINLSGDIMRLKQIIVNLLSNAIKFTSEGSIEFSVSCTKMYGNYAHVHFSVKDTGIGIEEENIAKIFKSFEQADSHTTHQFGGTGLGLAISSNLVRLMGGSLEVKSEFGKGSEFFFGIDMKIPEDDKSIVNKAAQENQAYDFTDKRVLLAEDNELNAEIALTLLKKAGLSVDIAHNGKEAVYMFETSGIKYYDIILMDIRMPEMDGIEAARQIRSMSRSDADSVIIIAMTANAFDDDRQKALDAGMNEYLVKPVNVKLLYRTINNMFSNDKTP